MSGQGWHVPDVFADQRYGFSVFLPGLWILVDVTFPATGSPWTFGLTRDQKFFQVAPAPSLSPRPWQDRLYSIHEIVICARTQLLQGRNEKWSGNFTEAAGSACGGGTSLMFLAHTWKENKKEGSPNTTVHHHNCGHLHRAACPPATNG